MFEKTLKKGKFTAEEDAVIKQRVLEWGNKGHGLWIGLEQDLGRASSSLLRRWNTALSPTVKEFKRGPCSEKEVFNYSLLFVNTTNFLILCIKSI